MSPVQLLLRPSPWVETCFFVLSRFLPPWPKNASKPTEKPKKQRNQKVSPHVTCPASPQTLSMGRNFFFGFLEVFATVSVQQYQLLIFLCFLFSCFLGSWEKFAPWQHPLAQLPPLHLLYWWLMSSLSYWFWLLSQQRKCTVKTALSPTSSGTPLDWCFIGMPRLRFLIFKGLARVLQTWNHKKWYPT